MERDARDWSGMTCEDGSTDIDREAPFHRCNADGRVVDEKIMTDRQALDANWKSFWGSRDHAWTRCGDYLERVGSEKAKFNLGQAWADLIKAFRQEWQGASKAIVKVLTGPEGDEKDAR